MIVPITYELGEWMFRKYTTTNQIEDIGWQSSKKAYDLFRSFFNGSENVDAEDCIKQMPKILNRVKVGSGKSVRYYYKDDEVIAYYQSLIKNEEEIVTNAVVGTQLKVQGYLSEYVVKLNLHRVFTQQKVKQYIQNADFIDFEMEYIKEVVKSICIGDKYKNWYFPQNELNGYLKNRLIELKS